MSRPLSLRAIQVSSYKAFPGTEELILAPLTILFGRNGAGKSALARLPAQLAAALSGSAALSGNEEPGLPLQVNALRFGDSLLDLVHGRIAGRIELVLKLQDSAGEAWVLQVELGSSPDSPLRNPAPWVFTWMLASANTNTEFRWDKQQRVYVGNSTPLPHRFSGLLPLDDTAQVLPLALPLRQLLSVVHLGSVRLSPPSRFVSFEPKLIHDVGLQGEHTLRVLGALKVHNQHQVLQEITAALKESLCIELSVEEVLGGAAQAIAVRGRPTNRSTWSPIDALGTGLQHALPFVVQQLAGAHARSPEQAPLLLSCEEPEAHLHPQAQAQMADIAIKAAQTSRCSVLVETHSETFVLRVRRRIAEGLDPEMVALYWVDDEGEETVARHLPIAADGSVEQWPESWFSTAVDEVRAIYRAAKH